MAFTLPQHSLDAGFERIQHIHRHKSLHRAGKAAAMDAVCTPTTQQRIAQSEGYRHILMLRCTGRGNVLQVHPGAAAGLGNQTEEGFKITIPEGLRLKLNPLVLLIEMNGPEDCPIRHTVPQFGQCGKEIRLRDLPQDFLTEEPADLLQLAGDGSVLSVKSA